MRLTLRTLLAYLDDILEPEDRETLAQKIDESQFAKSLIERTGTAINSPKLGSPQPVGSGLARDPNSVAEYLDNTMAPEQIQEFERICLESDIHLAEVASCHRILTMVLGEPVHFDAASRERMYRLAQSSVMKIDRPHAGGQTEQPAMPAPTEGQVGQADSAAGATPLTSKPIETSPARTATEDEAPTPISHVPDYLRSEAKSRFWPLAMAFVVAAIITGGVLMLLDNGDTPVVDTNNRVNTENGITENGNTVSDGGQPPPAEHTDPIQGDATGDGRPLQVPAAVATATDVGTTPAADSSTPETNVTTPDGGVPPLITPPPAATDSVDGDSGDGDSVDGDSVDGDSVDGDSGDGDSGDGDSVDGDSGDGDSGDGDGAAPHVAEDGSTDTGETVGPLAAATLPATDKKAGGTDKSPDVIPGVTNPLRPGADPSVTLPEADASTDVAPPQIMGRLLSHDQVLLATTSGFDEIQRLPVQSTLHAGQKLIALPTFRPMISIVDMTIELDGGTMIELTGLAEDGVPSITIHYGRFVARALSMPNSGLRVQAGDQLGTIVLNEATSAVGVEVQPFRIPGSHPEENPARRAVDLYAASGTLGWNTDAGNELIDAGVRRVLSPLPNEKPETETALPNWLSDTEVSGLDKRAMPLIEQSLGSNAKRSVKFSLAEIANHKKLEFRRLAMRCCSHIGYYDPLITSLNKMVENQSMRTRWNTNIAQLRNVIARDAQTAARVREAFERLRGDNGFELYRMLWGYSSLGLRNNGEAAQLVGYLDHEDLDFRVMSFWNLQEITGQGHFFRPESPDKNRRSIQRWRDLLERDEIVPATTD